jgi:hypothetical protein
MNESYKENSLRKWEGLLLWATPHLGVVVQGCRPKNRVNKALKYVCLGLNANGERSLNLKKGSPSKMEAWGLQGFSLKPNLLDYIRRPVYQVETSWSDYFFKTRENFELKF